MVKICKLCRIAFHISIVHDIMKICTWYNENIKGPVKTLIVFLVLIFLEVGSKARRYYRNTQDEEEAIELLMLFMLSCILKFLVSYWQIILMMIILLISIFVYFIIEKI